MINPQLPKQNSIFSNLDLKNLNFSAPFQSSNLEQGKNEERAKPEQKIEEKVKRAAKIEKPKDLNPYSKIKASAFCSANMIRNKPNFEENALLDLKRQLGFSDYAPEEIFESIFGEFNLNRMSLTYFQTRVEVLILFHPYIHIYQINIYHF